MAKKILISPQVDSFETDLSSELELSSNRANIISGNGVSNSSVGGKNPTSPTQPITCTATPYSQGYDNKVNYAYNLVLVYGVQQRKAYVECGYFD